MCVLGIQLGKTNAKGFYTSAIISDKETRMTGVSIYESYSALRVLHFLNLFVLSTVKGDILSWTGDWINK